MNQSKASPTPPDRVNILGVGVSATNLEEATRFLMEAARRDRRGYVCVSGAHGLIESQDDPALRTIHNRSLLTVPDGMPLVWVGRRRGFRTMGRVYGPDLMTRIFAESASSGQTHFLFGGGPSVPAALGVGAISVAEYLKQKLEQRHPGVRIVGTYTPLFRPLTPQEESDLRSQVAAAKPDFLWVGLSTPKQERFMAAHLDTLDAKILLGVGAAFDFNSGLKADTPGWIKRAGLQWFYRMCQEPRRLAGRYLHIVPRFLWLTALQSLGLRSFPLDAAADNGLPGTAGTEPGPPERAQTSDSSPLEGRPPCRPPNHTGKTRE